MEVSEIKQQLHKAIEADATVLSDEQIKMLQEREEKYKSEQSKATTLDEFKAAINKKYGL